MAYAGEEGAEELRAEALRHWSAADRLHTSVRAGAFEASALEATMGQILSHLQKHVDCIEKLKEAEAFSEMAASGQGAGTDHSKRAGTAESAAQVIDMAMDEGEVLDDRAWEIEAVFDLNWDGDGFEDTVPSKKLSTQSPKCRAKGKGISNGRSSEYSRRAWTGGSDQGKYTKDYWPGDAARLGSATQRSGKWRDQSSQDHGWVKQKGCAKQSGYEIKAPPWPDGEVHRYNIGKH